MRKLTLVVIVGLLLTLVLSLSGSSITISGGATFYTATIAGIPNPGTRFALMALTEFCLTNPCVLAMGVGALFDRDIPLPFLYILARVPFSVPSPVPIGNPFLNFGIALDRSVFFKAGTCVALTKARDNGLAPAICGSFVVAGKGNVIQGLIGIDIFVQLPF